MKTIGRGTLKAPAGNGTDGEAANFDPIARCYRFFEYLAVGPLLQRTRAEFIGRLGDRRAALVLGDGDGRFVSALLAANPSISVHAVDTSGVMLSLLRRRVAQCTRGEEPGLLSCRVETHCEDALKFSPDFPPDLIVTHFFLDCLLQAEVDALVRRSVKRMVPGGMWLVSEFRIPDGPMRGLARIYVRTLYFAFRVLTGLRATRLPDYATRFMEAGLTRVGCRRRLFGLLTSELWQK